MVSTKNKKTTKKRANNSKRARRKNRTNKTTIKQRGGESEQQKIKNKFVGMFVNAYNGLITAISKKQQGDIARAITAFDNGFKSNRNGINTLVPVTNNTIPILKEQNSRSTPILRFVPPLVVLFKNIRDVNVLARLTTLFLFNSGNINLTSSKDDITVLSTAVELQNKELVSLVMKNGGEINVLTVEQRNNMTSLMREEENVVAVDNNDIILVEEPVEKPVIKLDLSLALPEADGYAPGVEPDFWKPIFTEGALTKIRHTLFNMMRSDANIPISNSQASDVWSACKIIQRIIPTNYVETTNKPYYSFNAINRDIDVDFSHYNIVLCTALLVFGVISNKMIGQDYSILFKGGKAIQLELANIPDTPPYETEDIDIIIIPNKEVIFNKVYVETLAGHIAYLVKWVLNQPEEQFAISVQSPNPANSRANPFLFKLSYIKTFKKPDYKQKKLVEDYKQFSDIDFREMPSDVKDYFEKTNEYPFYIEEIGEQVLFKCPNIGALLDEKIFYLIKYMRFKQTLEYGRSVDEVGYQSLSLDECNRILAKFTRAIIALNSGLQKKRFAELAPNELLEKQKASIRARLDKMVRKDNKLKDLIVAGLYPI